MPKVLYMSLLDVETSAAHRLLPVADLGGLPLPVAVAEMKAVVGEEARGFFSVVELLTGRWLLLTPLKVLSEAERELVSNREPLRWCVLDTEEKVPPKELVGSVLVADPFVTAAVRLFRGNPGAPAAMLGTSAPRASKCTVASSAAGMLLGS